MRDAEEHHECERLQRLAWGFAGDLDVIPLTQLVAAQKAGGIVLGAFDDENRLLGFCYGILGRDRRRRLLHYSHMLAVRPDARSAGIAVQLKRAQREAALQQGLEIMIWTYDPLESLNAHLNFNRLGVVARRYLQNMYGETSSELHRGLPTDRLLVEWHLEDPGVRQRIAGDPPTPEAGRAPWALRASAAGSGPGQPDLGIEADDVRCEIPATVQDLKRVDPEAALEWRMATRAVFCHYLEDGYRVLGFCRPTGSAPGHYLISRRPPVAERPAPGAAAESG